MSVNLEWAKLDSTLSSKFVELLNKHLLTINRPSFIGPVEVTSFEFGSTPPDVEIVDIRDIYRDFLEDDEEDSSPVESVNPDESNLGDDSYEWVSRGAADDGLAQDGPAYHHLPPHLRYGRSASADFIVGTPPPGLQSPRSVWDDRMSLPNLPRTDEQYSRRPGTSTFIDQSMSPPMQSSPKYAPPSSPPELDKKLRSNSNDIEDASKAASSPETMKPPGNHPDLQLHLHILYDADIRLTITTSLLINYPSPMFMSLPIKLSVVGLVFNGEVVAAYEGSRRRIHICILDDLDPYGLSGDHRKRDSALNTPPRMDDVPNRTAKPLPVGQRLLPSILIESEIGQTDKHVLRNVTRVEKFIQDVIRKTLEEELVFPNFHTLVLGDE